MGLEAIRLETGVGNLGLGTEGLGSVLGLGTWGLRCMLRTMGNLGLGYVMRTLGLGS